MAWPVDQITAALNRLADRDLSSLQIMAAEQLTAQYYPHLDPGQPTLLVWSEGQLAGERLRHVLLQAYPPTHAVELLGDSEQRTISVAQLNEAVSGARAGACFIPPLMGAASYEALQDIVAHLRSPEGCPWDRELTWARLRAALLEETYELLAALDADDPQKVREELGDLLLQVGLQTQIATEMGCFRFPEVVEAVTGKLIRRHPHVFGDVVVNGTAEVLSNWEAIKRAERAARGDSQEKRSPLAGIPAGLPALAQAGAYLDRMSRLRKTDTPETPWAPLAELPAGAAVTPDVLGRVLFDLVAWAQARGLDAESALRETNARFAAQVADENLSGG